MSFENVLIVLAMPEEGQGLFEKAGASVVYTGIGKVNAAYKLMKALSTTEVNAGKPKCVLNFGTAGSSRFATHDVIECTQFVQRDIDLSALGLAPGVTPFEEESSIISVPKRFQELPTGICGTGDSFETGQPKVYCDVVDMEAYVLAKICRMENLPFVSVKYITDGADHNAHNDWRANLNRAAGRFIDLFHEIKSGRYALWEEPRA